METGSREFFRQGGNWSEAAPWCSGQACWPLEPATAVRIRSGLWSESDRGHDWRRVLEANLRDIERPDA